VKKNLYKEKSPEVIKKKGKLAKPRSGKSAAGSYRIIGGTWRSRRLSFPAIEGLRPTTDSVRETLFNWLASEIQGARVLDLFAGSGALGIEALSRGAGALLAIEKDKRAWGALSANLELLLPDPAARKQISVVCHDALAFLAASQQQHSDPLGEKPMAYDLIFLDPPFRKDLLEQTLALLDQHPLIEPSALIYIEREKEMTSLMLPKSWRLLKEKVAGQVHYQLFRREN